MSILSNAKEIADLVKMVGDLELYRRIVDLQGEIVELSSKNVELERRCAELEKALRTQASLTFREPFYYVEGDAVPFCAKCWEASKIAVHVIVYSDGEAKCPNCDQYYVPRSASGTRQTLDD